MVLVGKRVQLKITHDWNYASTEIMHRLNLYKASVYITLLSSCCAVGVTKQGGVCIPRVKTLIKTCPERSRRHWFTDSALGRVESRCIQCVKHILWNAKHGWSYFFDRKVSNSTASEAHSERVSWRCARQPMVGSLEAQWIPGIRSGVLGTMEELVVFGQSWVNVSVTSLLPDLASNCGGWLNTRRSIWIGPE